MVVQLSKNIELYFKWVNCTMFEKKIKIRCIGEGQGVATDKYI